MKGRPDVYGNLTTPAVCFHNPRSGEAVILLTDQGSPLGNHGITVEESLDRASAMLRLEAPGVRRDTLYTMVNTATPSWDRGADWKAGDAVTVRFRLYRFPAADVQALYDRFAAVRKELMGPVRLQHQLPFSAAFAMLEAFVVLYEVTGNRLWLEQIQETAHNPTAFNATVRVFAA